MTSDQLDQRSAYIDAFEHLDRTRHHEAGHAVAAYLLGFRFDAVSASPTQDFWGRVIGIRHVNPLTARRHGKRHLRQAENLIMVDLAGLVAEGRLVDRDLIAEQWHSDTAPSDISDLCPLPLAAMKTHKPGDPLPPPRTLTPEETSRLLAAMAFNGGDSDLQRVHHSLSQFVLRERGRDLSEPAIFTAAQEYQARTAALLEPHWAAVEALASELEMECVDLSWRDTCYILRRHIPKDARPRRWA